jgi:hypothetical protein
VAIVVTDRMKKRRTAFIAFTYFITNQLLFCL